MFNTSTLQLSLIDWFSQITSTHYRWTEDQYIMYIEFHEHISHKRNYRGKEQKESKVIQCMCNVLISNLTRFTYRKRLIKINFYFTLIIWIIYKIISEYILSITEPIKFWKHFKRALISIFLMALSKVCFHWRLRIQV